MKSVDPNAIHPSHDVLHGPNQPLDVFFMPKSIAVIGATETPGSVGRTLISNLIATPFGGVVFPVNPKRPAILGIKAYSDVASLPEPVELAVVATPAPSVPGIIKQCADVGVKAAIVISAGFKEAGAEGEALERQILEEARRGTMRLIGPNCLGVMSPLTGLNATFANGIARAGNVGFISQSGALLTAILDWSLREMVGFSAFVSLGSMLDVGWGDMIDYLGNDPNTRSILIYMESIGNARAFLSAAREVALSKPIIVIKAGRTEAAAKAAASHTGALTGSDEVLEAAFRRCGVVRVDSISDLFYTAEVLARQPRPRGRKLTIVTNAGGPGVLATDALLTGGGDLATLAEETIEALDGILPRHWSRNNPIDVLGDASPERYRDAVGIVANDAGSNGLLVILTPQAMTDPTQTAEQLKSYGKLEGRPILASWMGGSEVAAGESILNRAGIPTFGFPDTAARIFNYMWRYSYNLRGLYETPTLPPETPSDSAARHHTEVIVQRAREAGRTLLTEVESKKLLSAYGIPTVETRVAASSEEAVRAAEEIGFPVVLKLHSETITHKADVGGVKLNLTGASSVESAFREIHSSVSESGRSGDFLGVTVQPMVKLEGYEIILGSSIDAQFGPVLLFGSGGQLVEVYKDRALALPPLNTTLARRMMEQTRIFNALLGVRGRPPVDLAALEELMVRFSRLVVEQKWIKEIDINPLLVSHQRLIALDARVVVHGADVSEEDLPRLAIRPYPSRYISTWTMSDGREVTIRPIRPEDEPALVRYHETLSDHSVYMRYFHAIKLSQRTAHERLTRICFIDYDREMAVVATSQDPETNLNEILAVARLSKLGDGTTAEFSMLVSDRYQGRGLGKELLARLLQIARDEKIERLVADIIVENTRMQHISEKLGFRLHHSAEEGVVKAEIDL